MSDEDRAEDHSFKNNFPSNYAITPLSTPLYKQNRGHTVRIYIDSLSASVKQQGNREQAQSKT